MNRKMSKVLMFAFSCVFSVNICMTSLAITPPSNEVLMEALSGTNEINFEEEEGEYQQRVSIIDNTDVFFVYNAIPISQIESEDELRNLVEQANTDTIDLKDSNWVATEWQPSDEYFERVLSYDDHGELYESMNFIYKEKNQTTTVLMSDLLGEQYNSGMKNILLFGQDRTTPFGSELLVKVFDDHSVKIGALVDIERSAVSIKKGWYTLDEIKQFIHLYQSNGATSSNASSSDAFGYSGGNNGNVMNAVLLLFGTAGIVAILAGGMILYKKTKKNKMSF